jgi:plastocyanin
VIISTLAALHSLRDEWQMRAFLLPAALVAALGFASVPAFAAEPVFHVTIKDHKFEPAELEIPAKTKIKLVIKNADSTPEEFEMHSPKREKVIAGGQEGSVYLGPFAPGTYEFVGEFHEDTARGRLVVK